MRLERARPAAGAAGEEEAVLAELEQHGRELLQGLPVERVGLVAVHRVRAQVVHEKPGDPVREEVQPCPVREGGEPHPEDGEPEEERVEVRGVGGDEHDRPDGREPLESLDVSVDADVLGEIRQLATVGEDAGRGHAVEQRRQPDRQRARRERVDARVEVSADFLGVVGHHVPHEGARRRGAPRELAVDACIKCAVGVVAGLVGVLEANALVDRASRRRPPRAPALPELGRGRGRAR